MLSSVLMLAGTAIAANTTTYALPELDMELSIPDELAVFTRELDASAPNLSKFGLDKDTLLDHMISSSIYLNAIDADASFEVTVTMTEVELPDFNLLSDIELSSMMSSLDSLYQEIGYSYLGSEIYQNHQSKFVKINFTQSLGDTTVYSLQYYTVRANKAINITLHSYTGEIASAQQALLHEIVDSAVFGTTSQLPQNNFVPTEPFEYCNEDAGVLFTVPANWVEEPFSGDWEYVSAAFLPCFNADAIITYSYTDIWAETPFWVRLLTTRADVDHSLFSREDAAEIFGISASDVSSVTYNGREYYCAHLLYEGPAGTTTGTQMMRMENGYIHTFLFAGSDTVPFYADFEALLETVLYRTLPNDYSFANILFSLLLTIVIYSLPVIIYRYAIRKSPVTPKKAKKITILYGICAWFLMTLILFALGGTEAAGSAVILWSFVNYRVFAGSKKVRAEAKAQATQTERQQEAIPCPHCGALLPADHLFCTQCGEKLPERK